jgi:hypothetical protein
MVATPIPIVAPRGAEPTNRQQRSAAPLAAALHLHDSKLR